MEFPISRRLFLGGVAVAGASSLLTGRSFADGLPLPSSPVELNIVDAAGNLALTQPIFDNYVAANPKLVSHITFNQAPAPELPGKIKSMKVSADA